jgi:hypothetical protein
MWQALVDTATDATTRAWDSLLGQTPWLLGLVVTVWVLHAIRNEWPPWLDGIAGPVVRCIVCLPSAADVADAVDTHNVTVLRKRCCLSVARLACCGGFAERSLRRVWADDIVVSAVSRCIFDVLDDPDCANAARRNADELLAVLVSLGYDGIPVSPQEEQSSDDGFPDAPLARQVSSFTLWALDRGARLTLEALQKKRGSFALLATWRNCADVEQLWNLLPDYRFRPSAALRHVDPSLLDKPHSWTNVVASASRPCKLSHGCIWDELTHVCRRAPTQATMLPTVEDMLATIWSHLTTLKLKDRELNAEVMRFSDEQPVGDAADKVLEVLIELRWKPPRDWWALAVLRARYRAVDAALHLYDAPYVKDSKTGESFDAFLGADGQHVTAYATIFKTLQRMGRDSKVASRFIPFTSRGGQVVIDVTSIPSLREAAAAVQNGDFQVVRLPIDTVATRLKALADAFEAAALP